MSNWRKKQRWETAVPRHTIERKIVTATTVAGVATDVVETAKETIVNLTTNYAQPIIYYKKYKLTTCRSRLDGMPSNLLWRRQRPGLRSWMFVSVNHFALSLSNGSKVRSMSNANLMMDRFCIVKKIAHIIQQKSPSMSLRGILLKTGRGIMKQQATEAIQFVDFRVKNGRFQDTTVYRITNDETGQTAVIDAKLSPAENMINGRNGGSALPSAGRELSAVTFRYV